MANAGDTSLWLQLGVAGCTLLILFVTIGYLFRFMGNVQKDTAKIEDNKIDKLCDKIDNLVNVIAEDRKAQEVTRLSNEKDIQILTSIMSKIITQNQQVLEKVTIIEERGRKNGE